MDKQLRECKIRVYELDGIFIKAKSFVKTTKNRIKSSKIIELSVNVLLNFFANQYKSYEVNNDANNI